MSQDNDQELLVPVFMGAFVAQEVGPARSIGDSLTDAILVPPGFNAMWLEPGPLQAIDPVDLTLRDAQVNLVQALINGGTPSGPQGPLSTDSPGAYTVHSQDTVQLQAYGSSALPHAEGLALLLVRVRFGNTNSS